MSLSTIAHKSVGIHVQKTGYPLTLDFLYFINHQQRCTARFDLHVWSSVLKNIGDSKTFFLSKAIAGKRALSKSTRFYFEHYIIDATR